MLRLLPFFALVTACAAAPPPAPVTPGPPSPAPGPAAASSAAQPAKPAVVPAAVPPPPALCAELTAHPASGCAPTGATRVALAAALSKDEVAARDAALACLETNEELMPGSVRALRAELAPEVCADALATPLVETPPKGLTPELENTLLGLVTSARLARLLTDPPKLEGAVDRERFMTFFREQLTPWVLSEAAAIEQLSVAGAHLSGYGRGLAAIAAGSADLRFVEMVRAVPLPDEMKADKQFTDTYYGQLDQALEPRKIRGRDAALVGLHAFAELGALSDDRVTRSRALLNELWAGSRVDALDRLLLPELEPLDTSTPELVLAARLPTFYAKTLLADVEPSDPKLLRALLERGVPAPLRVKLESAKLSEAAQSLYARALIESGRRFFRASDFKRAKSVLATPAPGELGKLLAALARALENGPVDATELMLKGPFVHGTGDVSALDAVAATRGRLAGFAAFDAAVVLELAPKPDDPAFWDELARRFERAEKLLATGARTHAARDAAVAREHAQAARATATALRAQR